MNPSSGRRCVAVTLVASVLGATNTLAKWALVMPPRRTNVDCTITYRQDVPVHEWGIRESCNVALRPLP